MTHSILVTDSGLGGLSVFNDIARQLEQSSPWETVQLTYFNAWPAPCRGYNHYPTPEKRIKVFNNAMNAMLAYSPDRILIACNTLSVIYPQTEFAASTNIPVQGIVDHGVQMLHDRLTSNPGSKAVVFGTPTTIQAKSHKKALTDRGIEPDRIITTACTDLAGFIEREPFSQTVTDMIQTYVKEAVDQMKGFSGRVYAALCCTHFGYRKSLFKNAFEQHFDGSAELLNPNEEMAKRIFDGTQTGRTVQPAEVKTKIVSQAVWSKDQVDDCLNLLKDSPESVRIALTNYEQNDHLFSVQ